MLQSSKMHDYFVGGVIGLVQAGIGHPFDTAKTLLQNALLYKCKNRRRYW